jgi:hypothetical protein
LTVKWPQRHNSSVHESGSTPWDRNKADAAALPSSTARDGALIAAGQHRISDAIALITATADKYNTAANDLRAQTATLPTANHDASDNLPPDSTNPPPNRNSTAPLPSPPFPDTSPVDTALAAANPDPESLPPAATGMLPTLMGTASSLPTGITPMTSAIPTTAAPSLASLVSAIQPGNSLAATAHGHDGANKPQDVTTVRVPKTGSVTAAIDAALDDIGISDPQARARWHAGYEVLIKRESGDNIDAVNLEDTNAHGPIQPDGAPEGSSRGLTQVTPGTFRQFHAPGTSTNIYDPVANIAASIRYVMARYHVSPTGIDLADKVDQANPNSAGGGY